MRRPHLVVLSIVVLLGTLLVGGGTLAAQDSAPADYTGHPLVGSWLLDTDGNPETLPSLAYYAADGGYIQIDSDGVNGLGAWEPSGDTTGNLIYSYVDEKDGMTTIRANLDVSEDGQTITADWTLEFLDPATGEWSGEIGPGTVEATRIAVEGPGPPVASFEDMLGTPEGTPEATPAG